MNGRVYDPTVGRFLSVDPIVRDAAASQSWNGYGYVEGQVLSATDPSGYACGTHSSGSCKYVPEESPFETIDVWGSRLLWELSSAMDWVVMWAEGNSGGIRDEPLEGGGGTAKEPGKEEPQTPSPCRLVAPTGQYTTAPRVDARFNAGTAHMLSTALSNLNQQGITPVMTSGYRSPDAQDLLRSSYSPYVITPARVSWHQVGAAVDFGPNVNGSNFNAIASEMTNAGFVWGGNFATPDRPHFQSQPAGTSPSAALVASCSAAAGGG